MLTDDQDYRDDAVACRQYLASLYDQDDRPGDMCILSSDITNCLLNNALRHQKSGITTIYGRAGSGKSVLATQIAKNLKAENSIMLSFYFCIGDYRRRSYFQLLLSFVLQILYQGYASFDSAYVRHLHSLMPPPEDITASHLYRLLCGMLNKMTDLNVICVIDALDECDENSRLELIGDLRRLVVGSPTRYKVFITCRPTDSLVALLGPFNESNSINLDQGLNEQIALLLNRELRGNEFADLRDRLVKDNATPLVIGLVSAFCQTTATNTMQDFSDYDAIYEHILKQIDAPHAWLQEVLLCVAFAKRPLTINELAGSMWIAPSSSDILRSGQLTLQKMLIAAPTQLKRDLKVACSPLLRVDNGVVRLVHGTLREFIRKRSCTVLQTEIPQDGHKKTQLYMLRKCFRILSMPELWKMSGFFSKRRPFDILCDQPSQPHMFALYAGSCLALHMREDAEDVCGADHVAESVVQDNIDHFLDNQDASNWWIRTFSILSAVTSHTAPEFSKLQICASTGAWAMIESLIASVGDDEVKIKLALWDAFF
jgi:hypothetical protein